MATVSTTLRPNEHVKKIIASRGYVETEEAARILGCSINYLRNKIMLTYRLIEPVKLGKMLYWRKADLEEYLAEHPRLGKNRRTSTAA